MSAGLEAFQDRFAHALIALDPSENCAPEIAGLVAQPGFTVYRNTVMKGCIDAMQANYLAITRLVGEEWFRAAAAVFARANPPRHPMLADYGAGFADSLAGFEPAAELPYLPAVARLDRFWSEAHIASDAEPLAAGALARPRSGTTRPRRAEPASFCVLGVVFVAPDRDDLASKSRRELQRRGG